MENFKEIIYNLVLSVLIGFSVIFGLSCVGFIIHIPINPVYSIIALIVSVYFLIFHSKKTGLSKNLIITEILIFCYLIIFGLWLSGIFYDFYWDSRTYHQGAMILMNHGYNPIWDNLNDIKKFNYYSTANLVWIENYVKFGEIIGANILALTGKIELSKVLNFLTLSVMFLYSMYTFINLKKIKFWQNVLLSLTITFCPVLTMQTPTFYVDGLLYCYFLIALFTLINFEAEKRFSTENIFIFISSIIILANLKFISLLYVALILIGYTIYLNLRKRGIKTFGKISAVIIVLILLTGINPYITNIAKSRNPLYPIYGEGKIDIMTHNTPPVLLGKNYTVKFFMSTFSEVNNFFDVGWRAKLPFTVTEREFANYRPDVRFCGFGIFWSGVFILWLLEMLIVIRKGKTDEEKILLLVMSILATSIILNTESWWARYIPQIWALPILTIIYSVLSGKNSKMPIKLLNFIIIISMFISSIPLTYQSFTAAKIYGTEINKILNRIKEDNIGLNFYIADKTFEEGSFFQKLDERGIEYNIADKNEFKDYKFFFKKLPYTFDEKILWDYVNND